MASNRQETTRTSKAQARSRCIFISISISSTSFSPARLKAPLSWQRPQTGSHKQGGLASLGTAVGRGAAARMEAGEGFPLGRRQLAGKTPKSPTGKGLEGARARGFALQRSISIGAIGEAIAGEGGDLQAEQRANRSPKTAHGEEPWCLAPGRRFPQPAARDPGSFCKAWEPSSNRRPNLGLFERNQA